MRGRRPSIWQLESSQPRSAADVPEPPEHLDTEALAEWSRIVPALAERGILAILDRAALASWCACWSRHVEAEAQLKATGGAVLTSSEGGAYQNPWLAISNKALMVGAKYLAEFGLTPTSRLRLFGKRDDEEELPPPLPSPGRHEVGKRCADQRSWINGVDFDFVCAVCGVSKRLNIPHGDEYSTCPRCDAAVYVEGDGNAALLCQFGPTEQTA
jgi:P27 family predicted phage terminase small subunit